MISASSAYSRRIASLSLDLQRSAVRLDHADRVGGAVVVRHVLLL